MKKILLFLFLISSIASAQTTYYWSSAGSDGNDGLTPSTPKQTMTTLQGYLDTATSGNTYLFTTGSRWDEVELTCEDITVNFGSYGTREMPILSGMKTISMVDQGGNVYRGIDTDLPDRTGYNRIVGYVTIDGNNGRIACYPDSGTYRMIDAGSTTSLTDNSESWNTNDYTGGYVVLRELKTYDWEISPGAITSNTSNTLTVDSFAAGRSANVSSYEKIYAIANSKNLVNSAREFAHWNDTLWVYAESAPTVRASVVDTILKVDNSTITMDSVVIMGANNVCVQNVNNSSITMTRCKILGSGNYLIRSDYPYDGSFSSVYGGNLDFHAGEAAYAAGGFRFFYAAGSWIDSSYFHHIAVQLVDNKSYANFESGHMLLWRSTAGHNIFRRNICEKIRTVSQQHYSLPPSNECYFRENWINGYGYLTGDRGAIYVNNDTESSRPRIYSRNFILNARQQDTLLGQGNTPLSYVHGVYLDQNSVGFTIDSNTIVTGELGYKLNNSRSNNFRYNKLFDMNVNITGLWSGTMTLDSIIFSGAVTYNNITYNENALSGASRYTLHQHKYNSTALEPTTTLDYNQYNAPATGQSLFNFFANYTGSGQQTYSLAGLQAATSFETNSTITDYPIDSVRVFKNWSLSSHTFDLGDGVYKDGDGANVSGTLSVPAMYSDILYLINADEDNRDPVDYVDTTLVPFYGAVQATPEPTPDDTLRYYQADTLFKAQISSGCSESTVIYQTAFQEGGDPDTIGYMNFVYWENTESGWDYVNGQVSLPDSVQFTGEDAYLINTPQLSGAGNGTGGDTWPFNVNYYNHSFSTDSVVYTIRGDSIVDSRLYAIGVLSSALSATTRYLVMKIGSEIDSVNAASNNNNTVTIDSITPVNNSITITFKKTAGLSGYINALFLIETIPEAVNDTNSAYVVWNDVLFDDVDSIWIAIDHGLSAPEISSYIVLDSINGDTLATVLSSGASCDLQHVALSQRVDGTHELYSTIDSLDQYVYISLETYEAVFAPTTTTFYRQGTAINILRADAIQNKFRLTQN